MTTSKKQVILEAPCPKCGEMMLRANQKFLVLGNVWQCSQGHVSNVPPAPRKAKRP